VLRVSGSARNFPGVQLGGHSDTASMSSCAPKLWLLAHYHGWQALVESDQNPYCKSILDSTRGIFFFATPHQGLCTDALEQIVDADLGGQTSNLIMQLKEGSEFLENQKEHLLPIWDKFKQKVVSFYETVGTPSVSMVSDLSPVQFIMILTSFSSNWADLREVLK